MIQVAKITSFASGVLLAWFTTGAGALGLTEVLSQSPLGSPLRVSFGLITAPGESPRPECFRIAPPAKQGAEDLPQLHSGQFSIEGSGDSARLLLSSARIVNDPVLRVAVRVGCDQAALIREFTLLLDPPLQVQSAAAEAVAVPAAAPTRETSGTRPAGQQDGSGRLITEDMPPAPRARSAGTEVAARTDARNTQASLPAPARPAAPSRKASAATGDRLRLMASVSSETAAPTAPRLVLSTALSERDPNASPLSEDALALLRAKQARLRATPEDQDLTRSVEAELVVLDKRLKDLQATLDAAQARVRNFEAKEAAAAAVAAAAKPAPPTDYSDWFVLTALTVALGALAYLLVHRRRRLAEMTAEWPPESPAAAERLPEERLVTAALPSAQALAEPVRPKAPSEPAAGQGTIKPGLAYYQVGDTSHHLSVSELAQITEEARVFLTLGHPDKAILALREHVDLHPETAPAPWLMLLDLYRRTDNRGEYERTGAEFRHRYNAFIPSWEDPGAGQDGPGLEAYPHLIKQICDLWSSPTCKVFLDELLYDNRGGNRIGFNLAAYQDIMLLRSLLELIEAEPVSAARDSAKPAAPAIQPLSDLEFELDQDLLPTPVYRCTLESDHPGILERLTLNWGTPHAVHFLESLVFADHTAQSSFSQAALSELMLLHDVAVDIAGLGGSDHWEQEPGMGRQSARQ